MTKTRGENVVLEAENSKLLFEDSLLPRYVCYYEQSIWVYDLQVFHLGNKNLTAS